MGNLSKFATLRSVILGAPFDLGKRDSNLTVSYTLIIDVPAAHSSTGRRNYARAEIGFTAVGMDSAGAQAWEHAERMAEKMLSEMLKPTTSAED